MTEPTTDVPREGPRTRPPTWAVATWVVWTVTAAVAVVRHEPWRDELQAWAIARDTPWPWDLLRTVRYEGHPPLWHLLLWFPAQIDRSPALAQCTALACGAAAVWLVLRHAPFHPAIRALFVFGYWVLYESVVVARSYSLLLLLVIAALVVAGRRPLPVAPFVACLVGIVWTLASAAPLVVALACGVGWWRRSEIRSSTALVAGGVLLAAMGAVAWFVSPPANGPRVFTTEPGDTDRLRFVLAGPLKIVLPWFDVAGASWERFVIRDLGDWTTWVGLGVALVVLLLLRRCPSALIVWLVGAGGYLAMVQLFRIPQNPRHLLPLWWALVSAAWVAAFVRRRASDDASPPVCAREPSPARSQARTVLLGAMCAVFAVGTIAPLASDLRHPFSGGEASAAWVERSAPDAVVLCAVSRPVCSSVAIRLDVPAYSDPDAEPFTYVVWRSGWRRHLPAEQLGAAARRLSERLGRPVIVVGRTSTVPPECDGHVDGPVIVSGERYTVCRGEVLASSPPGGGT